MTPRLAVRTRLAVWYAAMVLGTGLVLLATAYWTVGRNVETSPAEVAAAIQQRLAPTPAAAGRSERPAAPPSGQRANAADPVAQAQSAVNRDALARTRLELALLIATLTALSALAGWLVAGRALRPVQRMTETAKRVSDDSLHERIALPGPEDELKDLADTFDAMLDRLDRAFAAQRLFVANAAHELRTPLTLARAQADVAAGRPEVSLEELHRALDVMRGAIERAIDLQEALLTLAEAQSGEIERVPVDLAAIVETAVAERQPASVAAGVTVHADLERPAEITGEQILLRQMVANLLDNAIRYNHPGGRVLVRLTVAHNLSLTIANTGQPVPPSEVADLVRPFTRLDRSRSRDAGGRGLGLAIVNAVAEAHGGELELTAQPEGGLCGRVTVPPTGSKDHPASCASEGMDAAAPTRVVHDNGVSSGARDGTVRTDS